ncbi:uncharacterized protein [Rutidosis leptorrhynchoides]|uniref:uncharacterized protein isoform X2 n=1 Tax=Rutidosis leptorrhynchoides TaxID=125765 RepID=UPI003A9936D2
MDGVIVATPMGTTICTYETYEKDNNLCFNKAYMHTWLRLAWKESMCTPFTYPEHITIWRYLHMSSFGLNGLIKKHLDPGDYLGATNRRIKVAVISIYCGCYG